MTCSSGIAFMPFILLNYKNSVIVLLDFNHISSLSDVQACLPKIYIFVYSNHIVCYGQCVSYCTLFVSTPFNTSSNKYKFIYVQTLYSIVLWIPCSVYLRRRRIRCRRTSKMPSIFMYCRLYARVKTRIATRADRLLSWVMRRQFGYDNVINCVHANEKRNSLISVLTLCKRIVNHSVSEIPM